MSAVLNVINSFTVTINGQTFSGSQGVAGAAPTDPLQITLLGECVYQANQLATADADIAWQSADDEPAVISYLFFWCDQPMFLQLLTAGGQFVVLVPAFTPMILPAGSILVNASTAALDGTATPTVVPLTKAVVCNRSGNTGNYLLAVFE